jgi:regulator of protease activity HflC (stomatin/prohibitin superfamily)
LIFLVVFIENSILFFNHTFNSGRKMDNLPNPNSPKSIISIIVLVVIFSLILQSYVKVETGHVGVVSRFGAVQPVPLAEGLHFKRPFMDRVEQIDVRLDSANANAISASKDLQTVKTQVSVQYSLIGALAPLAYQKIGTRERISATLVEPAIQESVKAVAAQYTAEQLITKRSEVKLAIQLAIENFIDVTLKNKGVDNALVIANVAITDFDFSPEFNRAIELKVKAVQEALQAENEKTRRVTQAEAGASEKTLAAEASAYAIEVSSKARADAIVREAKALKDNPQLIQLRIAEKWNGVLPKFTGGGAMPFLNIDKMADSK